MKRFIKDWGLTILLGVIILAIAFVARIYHLTLLPVFADEAIYIRWSQVMGAEPTLRFLPLSDGKQPLFMWLLMFAVTRFSDPLFIGRLVSVFSGLGTIIGIGFLSHLLFKNKKVALISGFIWAVSPFSFFFDRMALVDSLLACFGIWSIVLAVLTAKTQRLDMALLTGFALGGAVLTKSPGVFIAALVPLTILLSDLPKSFRKLFFHIAKIMALFVVSFVIAGLMYNIQRLGPNFNMLFSRTADYVFPISHLWQNPKDPFIPNFHRSLEYLWIMGPVGVMALGLISLVTNFKKYPREIIFLLICWLFPVAFQAMFAKVFTARYVLYAIPFVFLISGAAFLSKNKYVKMIAWLAGLAFLGQSLWFNYWLVTNPARADLPRGERSGYLEEWTAGTGIKEVSEYLKNQHAQDPNHQIVVGTEGYFGTLPDGLQIYMQGTPSVVVVGVGLNLTEVPSNLTNALRAGDKTYLVINSSRIKIEKEDYALSGLKLIKEYPKAERPYGYKEYVVMGPRDYLLFFEVVTSLPGLKL